MSGPARGGHLDPEALHRSPEWWAGYAAGHADGTAESALMVNAAGRAGHAAGILAATRDTDTAHRAGDPEHTARVRSLIEAQDVTVARAQADADAQARDDHPGGPVEFWSAAGLQQLAAGGHPANRNNRKEAVR